jgi:hypothetical protein
MGFDNWAFSSIPHNHPPFFQSFLIICGTVIGYVNLQHKKAPNSFIQRIRGLKQFNKINARVLYPWLEKG